MLTGNDNPERDVHARIRAYGSLAAEVADAGVPGVVAMRYNVYVVTAAQFVADLYAHLLAGRSLGEAATEARRALAADPNRQIGAVPVALQDWAVPLVYESAPLVLLRPDNHAAPVIRLTTADAHPGAADSRRGDGRQGDGSGTAPGEVGGRGNAGGAGPSGASDGQGNAGGAGPSGAGDGRDNAGAAGPTGAGDGWGDAGGEGPDGLPRPPDAGFFGRDETLLALDRAFDTQQVVLLHAFAGAGKSSTAAEFARWY